MMGAKLHSSIVLLFFLAFLLVFTNALAPLTFQKSHRSLFEVLVARKRAVLVIPLKLASENDQEVDLIDISGVIELPDDVTTVARAPSESSKGAAEQAQLAAPFLSQSSELDPDALKLDVNDAKQARVIIYIVLSLLPVLFLIPFMLGSRELLPLIDGADLPPVQL
jgi:hypothetical protein